MNAFTLEPVGESGGLCDCCGQTSKTVWGFIAENGVTAACYYVQWTIDHITRHGANFDIIVGAWEEGTRPKDRVVIRLEYRLLDNGPAFMIIDASARGKDFDALADRLLRRSDVIGTPLAGQVFALSDLILERDTRVSELLGGWTVGGGNPC